MSGEQFKVCDTVGFSDDCKFSGNSGTILGIDPDAPDPNTEQVAQVRIDGLGIVMVKLSSLVRLPRTSP